ncbi:hypothetical protein GCM10009430_11960 [Aquimarina litoralis]|uniref:DUF4141 domain-containing protein n=1 Tax=Aquimarina litoralis TaxID=584605 RepID=A0ABN1IKR0_9FLAO
MKTKKWLTILFILCSVVLNAQSFPFLTDPGSLTGSGVSTGLYSGSTTAERNTLRRVSGFNVDYGKRLTYLVTSAVISNKIRDEISVSFNRYYDLKRRNESLSFFNYSKRKENQKMLKFIEKMLNNTQKALLAQSSINVIYGEKLNLFQNTMKSLTEIHRSMDIVEDNIDRSKLLHNFFN